MGKWSEVKKISVLRQPGHSCMASFNHTSKMEEEINVLSGEIYN